MCQLHMHDMLVTVNVKSTNLWNQIYQHVCKNNIQAKQQETKMYSLIISYVILI